ncbi:MAG: histidine phosphatase family protein [Proteobacteria bacterium]|nr:histidine phosphatase family protein [Pseudomonadota bacterium]
MAEVWFIRHGESMSNAGHVVENTATVPLTTRGQAQAIEISKAFTTAPDLVVVTPYMRTQQTAAPTLERFPSTRREIWPLQEFACLSFANYTNTTSLQRAPRVLSYWQRLDPDHIDGAGAESFNMMLSRIRTGLNRLQSAPESFIAVFAHGRIMHTLRFLLECPQLSPRELMAALRVYVAHNEIDNGAIIRITADARNVRLYDPDKKIFQAGFSVENTGQDDNGLSL